MSKKFIIVFALLLLSTNLYADSSLKDFGPSPQFSGIDSDGHTFTSSEHLHNKISIVNFFFTSCDGPCPALMLRIKKIIESTDCKDSRFISISVDPERDTPETITAYRKSRGLSHDSWTLLAMEEDQLIKLLNDGFKLGTGGDIINHSTRIVIMDKDSNIRALIPGMDEDTTERVSESVRALCR